MLALRTARAALLVPVLEELFWRGWLPRWLQDNRFWRVPLGTYTAFAFWGTAALFAAEHGPFWEVGLACGVIYNWWMRRTGSLGDLILTHAVTNLALSVLTIATARWVFWMWSGGRPPPARLTGVRPSHPPAPMSSPRRPRPRPRADDARPPPPDDLPRAPPGRGHAALPSGSGAAQPSRRRGAARVLVVSGARPSGKDGTSPARVRGVQPARPARRRVRRAVVGRAGARLPVARPRALPAARGHRRVQPLALRGRARRARARPRARAVWGRRSRTLPTSSACWPTRGRRGEVLLTSRAPSRRSGCGRGSTSRRRTGSSTRPTSTTGCADRTPPPTATCWRAQRRARAVVRVPADRRRCGTISSPTRSCGRSSAGPLTHPTPPILPHKFTPPRRLHSTLHPTHTPISYPTAHALQPTPNARPHSPNPPHPPSPSTHPRAPRPPTTHNTSHPNTPPNPPPPPPPPERPTPRRPPHHFPSPTYPHTPSHRPFPPMRHKHTTHHHSAHPPQPHSQPFQNNSTPIIIPANPTLYAHPEQSPRNSARSPPPTPSIQQPTTTLLISHATLPPNTPDKTTTHPPLLPPYPTTPPSIPPVRPPPHPHPQTLSRAPPTH
jgi:hypothetical protein